MWYFNEQPFDETPDDYQGFVYIITELDTNKNISVRRTSCGLRYYQKIARDLDGKELKSNLTGENIMDLIKNFNYSLNNEGKIVTKERS